MAPINIVAIPTSEGQTLKQKKHNFSMKLILAETGMFIGWLVVVFFYYFIITPTYSSFLRQNKSYCADEAF